MARLVIMIVYIVQIALLTVITGDNCNGKFMWRSDRDTAFVAFATRLAAWTELVLGTFNCSDSSNTVRV